MARTPEGLQPDPRVAEAKQRLFGDEQFRKANPQMQLQMALIQAQFTLQALIANPNEQLDVDGLVVVQELNRTTETFIAERTKYETEEIYEGLIMLKRRKTPIAP